MPRGGARPGPAPLPAEQRRVLVAMRLPRASAELLRRLAELADESQADVVVAALERYEAWVRKPPRKRKHAVVV